MKKYCISDKCGVGFLKKIQTISLFMLLSFAIMHATSTHECKQWKTSVLKLENNEILRGFVAVKKGLVLPLRGEATVDIIGTIDETLDFNSGIFVLAHNVTLGSGIELKHKGSIAGNGYVVSLSGDISVKNPLTFVSDTIIDGNGSTVSFEGNGSLIINDNVQLTLKNMSLNELMTKRIVFGGDNAMLKIQKSSLNLSSDMVIQRGNFVVSGNVSIAGPYKFSLQSLQPTQISKHSVLKINSDVVFEYNPGGSVLHNLRKLLCLENNTSTLYCDGCTLEIPPSGLQLTKGRLIFENKVFINNYGNEEITKGFMWGDGTVENDLYVLLNAGARLEVDGCIHATT